MPASAFTGYIHFKDITTPSTPTDPGTSGTPLQGSSPTLQGGGSPPIQGSSPVLQGGTPPASGGGTTAPSPPTYYETTGGVTHTWTNYTNAGCYEGTSIPSNSTVQIACKLAGFAVADGNTWWYRIAASPWNGGYYASADAFYNNGQTSGSLHGTPFVDPNVPNC